MKTYSVCIFWFAFATTSHSLDAAALPTANHDEFQVELESTVDVTANDRDFEGDAFWIDPNDLNAIINGDCDFLADPVPRSDGMIDIQLASLVEPCEFYYQLTSRNIMGGLERSNHATVRLSAESVVNPPSTLELLSWTDGSEADYTLPNAFYQLDELDLNQQLIEAFTIRNEQPIDTGTEVSIDLDLQLEDVNLSLGDHGFGNADLVAELAPQQSITFEIVFDARVEGDVTGMMTLTATSSVDSIQLPVPIEGVVVDRCVQEAYEINNVPGLIEAEHFDRCGYFDLTAGNLATPGPVRTDEDVDVRHFGSRVAVTQMEAGEWLDYTVEDFEPGVYTFRARYSHPSNTAPDGQMRVAFGDVVDEITLPSRPGGGNQFYSANLRNLHIENAPGRMTLSVMQGGFSLDYVELVKTHELDSAPEAVADVLYLVEGRSEVTIRESFFLRNDQFDPYLLNPWSFEAPEMVIFTEIGAPASRATPDGFGNITIDLTGINQSGTQTNVFQYYLQQGGFESAPVQVDIVVLDAGATTIVANDDPIDLGTSLDSVYSCRLVTPCYQIGHLAMTNNDFARNTNVRINAVGQPTCGDAGFQDCMGHNDWHAGGFQYHPDPRLLVQGGTDSFQYEIIGSECDPRFTTCDTAWGTVHITFTEPSVAVNDFFDSPLTAPNLQPTWVAIDELLANDLLNSRGPELDTEQLQIPDGMSVTIDPGNGGLQMSFERPGRYQLGYYLIDELQQRSNVAWVRVDAFNTPPSAGPSSHQLETGVTVAGTTRLLLNTADADGDSLAITEVDLASRFGTVSVVRGGSPSLDYTPPINTELRNVPIEYTVTDGYHSVSATALVSVTVTFPQAEDDVVDIGAGQVVIPLASLLENDSGSDIHVDLQSIDTTQTNGTIVAGDCRLGGGMPTQLCFTPNGDGLPTSFRYRVRDRLGQVSAFATVTLD